MVAHNPQSSAAGVLALLQEPEPVIKYHALKTLLTIVPQFWAEISEHIAYMCAHNFHLTHAFLQLTIAETASLWMKHQI